MSGAVALDRSSDEPLCEGGLSSDVPEHLRKARLLCRQPQVCAGSSGRSVQTPDLTPRPQVNFNEPLSMLQRLTEDLEYHHLLDKAVHCTSSVEQMCLVAAFSVSSYSTTVHRIAKPFNPMLGETFELDRLDDMGLRSLCEQVRPAHASARPGGQSQTNGTRPLTEGAIKPRSGQVAGPHAAGTGQGRPTEQASWGQCGPRGRRAG